MKTVVTTLDLRQPADCIPRCPRPAGPLRRSSGLQAQRRLMHIKGAAVTQQLPPDKPEYSAHDSQPTTRPAEWEPAMFPGYGSCLAVLR
jgi:hypothetical protein